MTFPTDSPFGVGGDDMKFERRAEPEVPKRPTAQIPLEHWYQELSDLQMMKLPSEAQELLEDVIAEIHSYLKG